MAGHHRDADLRFSLTVRFLSSLAHELRTSLVPIRGYTRMLLEGTAGALNETQRAHLGKVLDGTNELVEATAPLIALSTLETLDPQLLNVHELLERWASGSPAALSRASLSFERELPGTPALLADARELRRALDEVLAHVARRVDEAGDVRVVVGQGRGGKELVVRVSANGGGRPQLRTEASAPLSVEARNVIRFHGGQIAWSESAGAGAYEVVVSLPTAGPDAASEKPS